MEKDSILSGRRNFLKQMLTASVISSACPHILLGRLSPQISGDESKITGIYSVKLGDYPDLNEDWGSVRIWIPQDLTEGFFAAIMLTRVPYDEYQKHFTCVYSICPHEGQGVLDLDDYHEFECSGHGTIFDVEGNYISGPAAQDLISYEVKWDGGDYVEIEIPRLITGGIEKQNQSAYLDPVFPNPAESDISVRFGLERPALVRLSISDINGREIQKILEKSFSAGEQILRINMDSLTKGTYFIKMTVDGSKEFTRKFILH